MADANTSADSAPRRDPTPLIIKRRRPHGQNAAAPLCATAAA